MKTKLSLIMAFVFLLSACTPLKPEPGMSFKDFNSKSAINMRGYLLPAGVYKDYGVARYETRRQKRQREGGDAEPANGWVFYYEKDGVIISETELLALQSQRQKELQVAQSKARQTVNNRNVSQNNLINSEQSSNSNQLAGLNQPKPKTFATSVTADVMQGLEQSSESQKFKDIGVCFGSIYQGMVVTIARPAGEIFLEQSKKLGAIVDMDKVKKSAINILTKACPTRTQDCIDQRVPKNTIGFLVGYDSALNNIQRRSQSPGFTPLEIIQVQQQFCKKYFNY